MVRFWKSRRPSGHLHDAPVDSVLGAQMAEVLSLEEYLPVPRVQEAGDGLEEGGLAGTVDADQRYDRPFLDVEGHIPEGSDVAVGYAQFLDFKQWVRQGTPLSLWGHTPHRPDSRRRS